MLPHEPDLPPPAIPAEAPAGEPHGSSPAPEVAAPGAAGPRFLLGSALAAGLLAAVGSWVAGEAVLDAYSAALAPRQVAFPSPEMIREQIAAQVAVASLSFLAQGALLGLAAGLAGGLARRSRRAALTAGALGALVGGVAGGLVSLPLCLVFYRHHDVQSSDLLIPLLVHAGIGSALGAAGGAALGAGLGGWNRVARGALGGLLGALGGAMAYEVIGALVFPLAQTHLPISVTGPTRLLARLLVTTLAALGAAWVVQEPRAGAGAAPRPV